MPKVGKNEQVGSILTFPKSEAINVELLIVSKMTSLKIYISSHGEARNIKFGQLVNLIQRVPLATLSWEVVMSLPHNHATLTNLFISRYREAVVIKFG